MTCIIYTVQDVKDFFRRLLDRETKHDLYILMSWQESVFWYFFMYDLQIYYEGNPLSVRK
jgi:hypothetical protein